MDHVFLRDHPPPKICRPLPSAVRFYRGTVSLATGGPQAGEGFYETKYITIYVYKKYSSRSVTSVTNRYTGRRACRVSSFPIWVPLNSYYTESGFR